jgi:hypothetical protein
MRGHGTGGLPGVVVGLVVAVIAAHALVDLLPKLLLPAAVLVLLAVVLRLVFFYTRW